MATIPRWMLDLISNPKTAKFVDTLKHSDLPKNWADDPEVVRLAERAWQQGGESSPFFKAYIQGTKALGKDKQPKKYFHGSTADFDTFFGPAIEGGYHARPEGLSFFTDNPEVAETYARKEMFNKFSPETWKEGANIYPVYLNIDRPLKVNAHGNYWNDIPYKGDYLQTNELGAIAKEDAKKNGVIINSVRDEGAGHNWKYDEPLKSTVAVTTDPRQIKSVFNRGTFNPADPNMMRSLAPLGIGAGTLAAAGMFPEDAEAAAMRDPVAAYRAITGKEPSEGVEDAWNPVESLLLAPIGAATTGARAASVGIDALLSALLGG